MAKRPIDVRRDGAFSMTIGTPEEGEITAMISLESSMYVVKQRAIYKIISADDIDPDRKNIAIPHANQLVAPVGSESILVARTLMTASALLKSSQLPARIDVKSGVKLYIELMEMLLAAEQLRASLVADQEAARKRAHLVKSGAPSLPSAGNVSNRATSFIQKAEHAMQVLFKTCTLFYAPTDIKNAGPMFDGFVSLMETTYGADDPQLPYCKAFAEFGRFIRNLRHCVEHPGPSQHIVTADYTLTTEGTIAEPSIGIVHALAPFHHAPLLEFMELTLTEISLHSECLLAYLCGKVVQEAAGFPVVVGELPIDQRRDTPNVRYGYMIDIGNGLQRLG